MKQYDIFLGNEVVGTAYVEIDGLYTLFRCRCIFSKEGIYRIVVLYGPVRTDLGTCIPDGNTYVAKARLPTKYLNDEIPCFYALKGSHSDTVFKPVELHKSFGYIDRLPESRFQVQGGKKGLLISKH